MKLEDMHHFEVGGTVDAGSADVSLTCLYCSNFHVWIEVSELATGPLVKLADLVQRADAHLEEAHR